jgi:membrane carboxypeptidase/penicillin-binding protein
MWMEFMKAYIDARPDKDSPPDFDAPGNIVFLAVDKSSGGVLANGGPEAIEEAFIAGTQPGDVNHATPAP